jgi:hypothetical protein
LVTHELLEQLALFRGHDEWITRARFPSLYEVDSFLERMSRVRCAFEGLSANGAKEVVEKHAVINCSRLD